MYRLPRSRASLAVAIGLAVLAGCATPPESNAKASAADAVPAGALNQAVSQATIQQTICTPGYAASVRPSTTYTNGIKRKLLRERGFDEAAMPRFELDHVVPLALGGHPRSPINLSLQPWEGEDGAKVKDRLERRLQQLVCTGVVPLSEAQRDIYVDWRAAWGKYQRPRSTVP